MLRLTWIEQDGLSRHELLIALLGELQGRWEPRQVASWVSKNTGGPLVQNVFGLLL